MQCMSAATSRSTSMELLPGARCWCPLPWREQACPDRPRSRVNEQEAKQGGRSSHHLDHRARTWLPAAVHVVCVGPLSKGDHGDRARRRTWRPTEKSYQ